MFTKTTFLLSCQTYENWSSSSHLQLTPCKTRPFRIGTISEHEVVHLVGGHTREDWGPNFVWPLTPKVKMKIILSALGSQSHGKKLWSGGLLGYTFTSRVVSRAWQIGPNPLKTFPQWKDIYKTLGWTQEFYQLGPLYLNLQVTWSHFNFRN